MDRRLVPAIGRATWRNVVRTGPGVALCLLLVACSGKNKGSDNEALLLRIPTHNESLAQQPESANDSGLQALTATSATRRVSTPDGQEWLVSIERRPNHSLPTVKGYDGKTYADNDLTLTVERGGKVVVNRRTWTKQQFAHLLDSGDPAPYQLEGMAVDDDATAQSPDGRSLVLVASMGIPETDIFVPIRILIAPNGHIDMEEGTMEPVQ